MKISFVCLLIISLFAIARSEELATEASNIKIDVFDGSNGWWIALAVRDANDDTQRVQIKDSAPGAMWAAMDLTPDWGYWSHSSGGAQHVFPASIRITSKGGSVLTFDNLLYSAQGRLIDTGLQFNPECQCDQQETTPTVSPTRRPTPTPTNRPTSRPTSSPTTTRPSRPTSAPTTTRPSRPTSAPTTTRPTSAPTTSRPTSRPTSAPTTTRPTSAPTTARPTSSGGSGCGAKMKLMVPLYTYPGASWDAVANGARYAQTMAIINPNSGPGNGPDSSYISYMQKLHDAGVEIVGYVHTSYGARSLSLVQADINMYAEKFPLLVGIFLDEVSSSANDIPYYTTLYNYIMGMPGWKYDVINPGTPPAQGYYNVATQIVSFENVYTTFGSNSVSYANCDNRDHFAVISYGASSSQMGPFLDQVKNRGYYGWVYVTDGAGGCCTYNNLASYYASQATYVGNQ